MNPFVLKTIAALVPQGARVLDLGCGDGSLLQLLRGDPPSLAACGANLNTAWASAAFIPRMRSMTRRAFMGVTRTYRAWALASMTFPLLSFGRCSVCASRSYGRAASAASPCGRP